MCKKYTHLNHVQLIGSKVHIVIVSTQYDHLYALEFVVSISVCLANSPCLMAKYSAKHSGICYVCVCLSSEQSVRNGQVLGETLAYIRKLQENQKDMQQLKDRVESLERNKRKLLVRKQV